MKVPMELFWIIARIAIPDEMPSTNNRYGLAYVRQFADLSPECRATSAYCLSACRQRNHCRVRWVSNISDVITLGRTKKPCECKPQLSKMLRLFSRSGGNDADYNPATDAVAERDLRRFIARFPMLTSIRYDPDFAYEHGLSLYPFYTRLFERNQHQMTAVQLKYPILPTQFPIAMMQITSVVLNDEYNLFHGAVPLFYAPAIRRLVLVGMGNAFPTKIEFSSLAYLEVRGSFSRDRSITQDPTGGFDLSFPKLTCAEIYDTESSRSDFYSILRNAPLLEQLSIVEELRDLQYVNPQVVARVRALVMTGYSLSREHVELPRRVITQFYEMMDNVCVANLYGNPFPLPSTGQLSNIRRLTIELARSDLHCLPRLIQQLPRMWYLDVTFKHNPTDHAVVDAQVANTGELDRHRMDLKVNRETETVKIADVGDEACEVACTLIRRILSLGKMRIYLGFYSRVNAAKLEVDSKCHIDEYNVK
ncbi:hypothetical protein DL89DRAFT_268895 [Linderina pennispora]|uniref:F-box domain-containing protein n=1 Tax=Linderina pennispora TaxID=61395 RepID=A0A1Y1W498_9FUNG|nr:uncharacterized protein DL89DRAFT_268895 [Linderina pennispora]ORX68379.1 hypothetical protein DL89DRAFT_268895 [Linderina pennispora]